MLFRSGLGNIAFHGDDLKEAEKWFEQARGLQPEHPAVLLAWGRLQAAKGNTKEAKELLEKSKATEIETSATLYAELGSVYSKLKIWDKAAEAYQQALRMKRRRHDWRLALGHAYAQLGKVTEAERKYREVLAFTPDDVEALKGLQALGKKF